jgi:hypothetical protein
VKFKVGDMIIYQARYSNCYTSGNHAEDFFVCDARHGALRNILSKYNVEDGHADKSITMYLTYQPCNESITETQGTRSDQSCCDILRNVYTDILQPRGISLNIRATHVCWLDPPGKANAKVGIQQLKQNDEVSVTGMQEGDWSYLFSLSHANFQQHLRRTNLDVSVNGILVALTPLPPPN